MSAVDPVRLIHSTTDLHRAHMIIRRIVDARDAGAATHGVLEMAFLADYSRPFIGLADESAPLCLERLNAGLTAHEIEMHEALMALAARWAAERRHGQTTPTTESLLGGHDGGAIETLVKKLRSAVTAALYPGVEPGSDAMRLLIGPLDSAKE